MASSATRIRFRRIYSVLTTLGGDEYCGQVIYTSMNELGWDNNPNSYKVIFIAGNEDFLQGNVHYTRACDEAKERSHRKYHLLRRSFDRYPGALEPGRRMRQWKFQQYQPGCKNRGHTHPYDSLLYSYNEKPNNTYVAYGSGGGYAFANQARQDAYNSSMSKTAGIKRIKAKSNSKVYNNAVWDMVDSLKKRCRPG